MVTAEESMAGHLLQRLQKVNAEAQTIAQQAQNLAAERRTILRELQNLGMTQRQIAKAIGISQQAVQQATAKQPQ